MRNKFTDLKKMHPQSTQGVKCFID